MVRRVLGVLILVALIAGCSREEEETSRERYCEGIQTKMQSGDLSDLQPGINLGRCTLRNLDFSGLDLHGAWFDQADASNSAFINADLSNAVMSRGNFAGADFTGANLANTDFTQSVLDKAVFTDAKVEIWQLEEAYSRDGIVYPDGSTE